MPSTLPCPNPVCTHLFDAEAVKGAASVVCPRCGTKLEFRAPAPPAARPPIPTARPVPPKPPAAPPKAAVAAKPVAPAAPARRSPPPLAKPVAPPPPTIPLATPVIAAPAPPSALAFGSKSDLVFAPRRRRGLPGWLIALLLVVVVFGGVAVLIFGAILNGSSWGRPGSASDAQGPNADEYKTLGQQGNFRFTPPGAPWQASRGLLGTAVAFRRSKPASSMALVFHDYHTRLPRDPELIDDALKELRRAMSDIEYEVKPKDEQSTLGGQPAVRLEFQGGDHDVPVHGECVAMAYRGVAYWFYTWAPVDDAPGLVDEWAGIREKFSVSNQREGWTEKPPETAVVQGDKPPYKLEYIKSVWEKQEEPQKYSPFADAVLLGYDPKDKDARIGANAATVQILALEKAPDLDAAVQKAKDALMDIEKEGEAGGVSLDVVGDKLPNTDNNTDVGAFHGHVSKLEVKKSGDPSKYAVLAVVRMDDGGVLAVVCECAWDRRDYWDQEFTALLSRLKPGKGK